MHKYSSKYRHLAIMLNRYAKCGNTEFRNAKQLLC